MIKNILLLVVLISIIASCRSTKKIQTAIAKKDSVQVMDSAINKKEDSVRFIRNIYNHIDSNRIDFKTLNAKISVNYEDADNKKYNVNAFVRMYKDSIIWVSVNAIFGIEALRVLITEDSVKLLDKQNKVYTARAVSYLKEVSALPLNLHILQNLIVGNPVFLDSNITTYSRTADEISMLSIGEYFKNLLTLGTNDLLIRRSKLDDINISLSRTGDLTYSDYENEKGVNFAKKRKITIAEKKKLDIEMDFKQYDFNEDLTFPFSIPRNYKRN
ncbi:MAG TPA: DUF4292 domain-containing protein [Chitinophagaceae bacterium]